MFCPNCGKEVPDNTNFCNHCGAQQPVNLREDPISETKSQPKTGKPKKKANIFLVLAIVLVAFLLGKFVIAPMMGSDDPQDSPSQITGQNDPASSLDIPDPAYDAVFEDTYIVHFQSFFNMDMASFAFKQEDGIICCADYGYEDDTVKQWVETMYVPVSEYIEAEKAELENTMKSQFAAVEALSCCTVSYNMSLNYFTVTCTYTDVDKEEHYTELFNAGILQENTFVSMTATEESLIGQGFIKK